MSNKLTPFEYSVYKEEIIRNVIIFIYGQLSNWRNNQFRTQSENETNLTSDLVTYLNKESHIDEQNFLFNHEEPQSGIYKIDFAAFPVGKEDDYTKKITVFECKRLPAPQKYREYEYISGKLGGIARFKLEKHGAKHKVVGMIGYVQEGTINDHLSRINNYIISLKKIINEDNPYWGNDVIIKAMEHIDDDGLFHGFSKHQRLTLEPVLIHHLWVVLY